MLNEEEPFLLGVGVALLAASLVLDVLDAVPYAVEDFPKIVGLVAIVSWCYALSRRSLVRLVA
jgi:hypothetical protein